MCYNENMQELFNKYGIKLNEGQLKNFDEYFKLLVEYNEKYNLTAILEKNEVYVKHFLDSVLGQKYLCGKSLIDIGSGGGFPALPLKIVDNFLNLTMLEATGKKCEFLEVVTKKLNLENVNVINSRAEEFAFNSNFREKFDMCTARAVARLNILVEYCLPFVKVGGIFIAYKGDAKEEISEAKNAVSVLGGKIEKIEEYDLEGAKRTLIVIKKVKSTDIKYPRLNGKIRKKPL